VQFKEPKRKSKPMSNDESNKKDFNLRRSKSYNGPDSKYQISSEETHTLCKYQTYEFSVKDLNYFPEDINDIAKRIVKGIL